MQQGLKAISTFVVVLSVAAGGCSDSPAEPVQSEARGPAGSNAATSTDPPLQWQAPAGWTLKESSETGARRAGYGVPPVGDDKEDTELLVLYFGKGKNGERDAQWDSWFGQFDGDAKKDAKRDTFAVGDNQVETFEFLGNYKLNLGQQRPGMKKSPVQMVKNNFRMIGAVVKTKDRGNWFFRMVGPDTTVLASKDGFLEMLRSVK